MRLSTLYIALWMILAAGLAMPGRAQDIVNDARRIHRIHRDALPQTTAYQMAADRRGWVWIATQSGVAYYNGRDWHKLEALSDLLPSSFERGRRLITTLDGRVWFAPQYGGVLSLDVRPGVAPEHWPWQRTTTREGLPSDSVSALIVRGDGSVLAGTSRGLAARRGDVWEPLAAPPGVRTLDVVTLLETRGRALWVATPRGLWVQRGDAWTHEQLPAPLTGRPVAAMHEDRAGRLWAVVTGGIARRDAGGWQVVTVDADEDHRRFTTILELPNGVMWFGTYGPRNGIAELWPDGTWHRVGLDNGLPSDDVLSLMAHPDGAIWIGTRNGIALYSGNDWAAITRESGLDGEYVWHIAEDARGAYWFGTDRGVSIFESGAWRTLTGPSGEPFTDIRFIAHTSGGTTYLANYNSLFHYEDGRVRLLARDESLRFYSAVEHGGEMLFLTATGVRVLRDGVLERYSTNWFTNGVVKAAVSSRDGVLWLAINRQGIVRLDGEGGYALYTQDHGLPATDVLDLYEDDLGLLWAATTRGASLFDGRRWRTLTDTTAVRLPDDFTYSVLQDAQHRYYISTNRGVARLTRSDAPAHVDSLRFVVETFGPGDGLPSYEANFGAALRDRRGRIWFGTVAGAAMFDPAQEVDALGLAPVEVERIEVEGLPDSVLIAQQRQGGPLRLSHRHSAISFTYTHGAVSRPEGIHYRTQLVGYDALSSWSEEGQRTFTSLPPGEYVFRIWGRGPDGVVSGPVDVPFVMAAAPWASWWAYFLYSLVGLLVMAGFVRWQTARIQQVHAQEAAVLQERLSRKAAEDQAEHLRDENRRLAAEQFRDDMIRMLVHDLRSPLSIMQMVCREVASMRDMPRETVNELMGHVVGTSEQALRLVDLILDVSRLEAGQMPVNTTRVVVAEAVGEALSALWRLAEEKGVTLEADVAPGLPALHADRRLLDRVLANLLGNAIKFTPEGGSVRLAAEQREDHVELRVKDTGTGIPLALRPRLFQKFVSGREEGSGSGLGLAFCRLAVEAMRGHIRMADTSKEGTTFVVSLPVERSPRPAPEESAEERLGHGDGSLHPYGSSLN